jgi:hypothetical protein
MDGSAARRAFALALSLFVVAGAGAQSASRPFTAGIGFGLVCEKGGNYARCAPASRVDISWSFGAGPLDMRVGLSGAAGAFFGQVLDIGAQATVSPRLTGRWKPEAGFCLAADCGSTLFHVTNASRSSSVPPAAMAYAGLVLAPLEFRYPSGWSLSFLESRFSLGVYGFPRSLRGEVGLIALRRSL